MLDETLNDELDNDIEDILSLNITDNDTIYQAAKSGVWMDGRNVSQIGLDKLVCDYAKDKKEQAK